MRPKVPRGTKASKALPIANSKVSGDKSFDAMEDVVLVGGDETHVHGNQGEPVQPTLLPSS